MTTPQTTIEPSEKSAPAADYRRSLPKWVQALVLLIVFAAGGVTGSMITVRLVHSRMNSYRQHAPVFSEDIVMRLRFRLGLSDEQAVVVQEIIERRHATMIQYRTEGSRQMHREFDTMVEEVETVLGENQIERWRGIAGHVKRTFLPTVAEKN